MISSGTLRHNALADHRFRRQANRFRLGLTSENAVAPSISRTGKRLVYGVRKYDSNIWRVDLREPVGCQAVLCELISSTKYEGGPAYSTDGKRIAFVSERTGAAEVWSCDSEGRNPVQLTSLGFVAIARTDLVARWPVYCSFWNRRRKPGGLCGECGWRRTPTFDYSTGYKSMAVLVSRRPMALLQELTRPWSTAGLEGPSPRRRRNASHAFQRGSRHSPGIALTGNLSTSPGDGLSL